MILCENFRTASDKYGEVIAREALNSGIPDKYILAACRFHCEKPNKDFNILKVQFRQWMTYVVPNSNQDVNTMCYGEFSELLRETMAMNNTPNCLYNDGKWSLGYWNSFKEARMCPFNTKWCICHSQKDWIKYTKVKGSEFFVVNCNDKDIPMEFHHICVEMKRMAKFISGISMMNLHTVNIIPNMSLFYQNISKILYGVSRIELVHCTPIHHMNVNIKLMNQKQ